MAKDLKPDDPAPAFTLPTDGGGTVSLSSLKGKTVVLYFYPKDDTSGCTLEAMTSARRPRAFKRPVRSSSACQRTMLPPTTSLRPSTSSRYAGLGRGHQSRQGLWRMGEEEHVWPPLHGHGACHLPHRRPRGDPQYLAKGQGSGHVADVLAAVKAALNEAAGFRLHLDRNFWPKA